MIFPYSCLVFFSVLEQIKSTTLEMMQIIFDTFVVRVGNTHTVLVFLRAKGFSVAYRSCFMIALAKASGHDFSSIQDFPKKGISFYSKC